MPDGIKLWLGGASKGGMLWQQRRVNDKKMMAARSEWTYFQRQ
jgi:hypothetical protein